MFYDVFLELCNRVGKKPRDVAKELEVKTSTLSMWKTKGVTPNATTLIKVADYFGVLVVDLLDENSSKIYNAGFIDGAVAESMQDQGSSPCPPNRMGKTETFQPFTETDAKLIQFGGFNAISEFYNLPEDAQKKASEDIRDFVEYVIEKYKKQAATEDKE